MYLKFQTGEDEVTLGVSPDGDDWRLVWDGREVPLQAIPTGDGSWLVETHQGRRRVWVAARGEERFVFCDGKVHTLRLPDPAGDDPDVVPAGGPCLTAVMPGKVVQVTVNVGQTVAVGQPVLIMESMKMETEVTAPLAGTVGAVHVSDGQIVGQGDALVDLVPDP